MKDSLITVLFLLHDHLTIARSEPLPKFFGTLGFLGKRNSMQSIALPLSYRSLSPTVLVCVSLVAYLQQRRI